MRLITQKAVTTLICLYALSGCGGSEGSSTTSQTDNSQQPVTTTNTVPIANAGLDQSAIVGEPVSLNGSASIDADGDTLTYQWSFVSKPTNSASSLTSATSVTPSFIPDLQGAYRILLSVSDSKDSAQDEVIINVSQSAEPNNTPVANAGDDENVDVGSLVTLNGNDSNDADGDTLTYTWSFIARPENSQATIVQNTSVAASFTADLEGTYRVMLTVSDGKASAQDEVVITASQSTANNLDITNIILTKTDGSCVSYVGTYESFVMDIQRGLDFNGQVTITNANNECTFAVNEIPNHDFNDAQAQFATDVSTQNANYRVSANPSISPTTTEVEIGVSNGVFLNGVSVDIMAAACYGVGNEPLGREKIGCGGNEKDHPWRYDPMSSLNSFGTDSHNAHPQPSGRYHYHGNPRALFDQNCDVVSPVIGFAADGFPIFGPCIESNGQVREAKSSYALKNNGGKRQDVSGYQTPQAGVGEIASDNYDGQFRGDWEYVNGHGDLDECNGMTVNGQYGYYITNSFPWVVGCYRGQVNSSFRPAGPALDNLLHRHHNNISEY